MKKIAPGTMILALLISTIIISTSYAASKEIILPKPDTTGGIPLMQALSRRQSSRSFSDKALPDRVLSNLLWAAYGINRAAAGKRTAPSAMNRQEIDIYVVATKGTYLYDAKKHSLKLITSKDIRALAGFQSFVKDAPVNLIYVANITRAAGAVREEKLFYSAADTGFICQNVYLFCASEGLSTVVRAFINKEKLAKELKLESSQMIILGQTVGYPVK